MKRFYIGICVIIICMGKSTTGFAQGNALFNPQFAEGTSGWHGIGEVVYLKPNGQESVDPVEGAVQVLKIPLKPTASREITQEFTTVDQPTQLQMHLEVSASADFKRAVRQDNTLVPWKANVTKVTPKIVTPQSDFWVRLGPGWVYYTAKATSKWSAIDVTFKKVTASRYRQISFCVPCGNGSIYIRNTQVSAPALKKPVKQPNQVAMASS